jgi:hypothetical protein
VQIPVRPLLELALRLELDSTTPRRCVIASSPELSVPSALEVSEIHSRGGCTTRFGPPSGFGHPLDGLLPPKPCRFCFTPAALLGFHPSEGSPPARWSRCYHRDRPTPVSPFVTPAVRQVGPKGPSSWALPFAGVPCRAGGMSLRPAGSSLGFRPFQGSSGQSCQGFRPDSSHVLGGEETSARRHLRVSIDCLPVSSTASREDRKKTRPPS